MDNKIDKILAEISAGELIDKITILEIKKERINDIDKIKNVEKELVSLNNTLKKSIPNYSSIKTLVVKLKSINLKLWDIENGKRLAEKKNDFSENFIQLARDVYKENDERSKVKSQINKILNSNVQEVKSHY
jgi:phenylalanyl-tRNA synthetase alpha subunit